MSSIAFKYKLLGGFLQTLAFVFIYPWAQWMYKMLFNETLPDFAHSVIIWLIMFIGCILAYASYIYYLWSKNYEH